MTANLLTHSRMACAKTCLRKHYFQYELCLTRERVSEALSVGQGVHKGMETGDIPTLPDPVHQAIVTGLLNGYRWYWRDDKIDYLTREQEFTFPVRWQDDLRASRVTTAAGKIDAIIKLPDGRLAVMEYKTCSARLDPESDYWLRLRIDQQISHYMLGARALGYDVETVLYDVIRRPTIRVKKTESPAQFADRLYQDIKQRPEYYFCRREIPRLTADLDEYNIELQQQAATLDEHRRQKSWYRNTSACLHPWRCEFLDICHTGVNLAQGVPEGFTVGKRHPELTTG